MNDVIVRNLGPNTERKCLDFGYVKLVDCMPRMVDEREESADYAIAEAARCSYQRGTKSIRDDKTLIRYLMRHDHTSPFEMIEFKFNMKIPIFVARQMVRHRMVSLSELSGRYSEMPEEYHVPEELRLQSSINIQGSEGLLGEEDIRSLTTLMKLQGMGDFKFYHQCLNAGVSREQSRIVLPLSTYTEWYWKIDLKNLLHFLDLRCDSHSQKEIQVYADAILDLIRPIVPWTIEAWEDYSSYRGGILLTKYEVESLKKSFSGLKSIGLTIPQISVNNKLEKLEWENKLLKMGIINYLEKESN